MIKTLLLFSLLVSSVFAKEINKIAVVNFATIEEQSKVTLDITNQIKKKQDELQKEVQSIQDDVQKKVKNLEKSASVLTSSALEQKKEELQKELVQIDEKLKQKAQKLENIKNNTLLDLNNNIKIIVEEIAKENEYDLVLLDGSVVYYEKKHDITQDVLQKLNKKIPSVKINWDQK